MRRAALPVDRRARDLLGQPRRQPARAGDVPRLRADGVDAAEQHVLHRRGVDVAARHERLQHVGAEVGGMHLAQAAAALADRAPYGVDDVGLTHLITTTDDPWPNSPWLTVTPTLAPST